MELVRLSESADDRDIRVQGSEEAFGDGVIVAVTGATRLRALQRARSPSNTRQRSFAPRRVVYAGRLLTGRGRVDTVTGLL